MKARRILTALAVVLVAYTSSAQGSLVIHYRFDEGTGTTTTDFSGNGYDGTIDGATWTTGYEGQGLEFDGTDDSVRTPEFATGDAQSVAMWIRIDSVASGQKQIFNGNGPPHMNFELADGQLEGRVYTGSANETLTGPEVPVGEWVHVAWVYDHPGDRSELFINGESVALREAPSPLAHSSESVIGRHPTATTASFLGMIDEVRVYDEGLTQGQILGIMTGAPWPFAFGPQPSDGSMIDETATMLKWVPGDLAASHDMYFGETFDEIDQAAPGNEAFQGNQAEAAFSAVDLTPGATYYWRIDEVNDAEPNSPWKGDVWSFRVRPVIAWSPSPLSGIRYVSLDQDLSWQTGSGALFHTVYFGESFDEVNDATAGGFMVADATYDPGPMESEKTYYWRIDEFDGMTTHKGDIWSFTTLPEVAVTDPNLAVRWTFNEGQGTNAVDWSGHGKHGAIEGPAQWTLEGYHAGALEFSGGGRVVRSFAEETWSAYTVALWAKASLLGQALWSGVFSNNSAGSDFQIDVDGTHPGSYRYLGIGGDGLFGPVSKDWIHLAASCDGTNTTLYYGGQNVATIDTADTVFGQFAVGINRAGDKPFTGVIDDVRVYDRALAAEEIQQVMRGDPLLAGDPDPDRGAMVDIRDASALRWSAGDTAASHDVYFGTDRAAVAAAGTDAAEFRGSQPGTSFSLAGRVKFGGGDYFWRIDEVEADGTVQTGYVWKFTVPDYLIVDDFESYTNEVGSRVFEVWIDGIGFTQPEPGNPGNGTGAAIGHDVWSVDSPYFEGTIMETANVYDGGQAMPIYYAGGLSEADRTFVPAQNWTVEGVTTLVVQFRGTADNSGQLYVKINGTKVPYDGDPADIASRTWLAWEIDLASIGVPLANVTTLTIGIEGGETGVLYVDAIRLAKL